jgi:hypothetical protein
MMFEWITDGAPDSDGGLRRLGMHAIATRLNELGIPAAKGGHWQYSSITKIIKNPIYSGKIRYRWRKAKKVKTDGAYKTTYPINRDDDMILSPGLHPAIVSEDVFTRAQASITANDIPRVRTGHSLSNPLAGICYCGKCGSSMLRRTGTLKSGEDILDCKHQFCDNIGTQLKLVEKRTLELLAQLVEEYEFEWAQERPKAPTAASASQGIKSIQSKIDKLNKQLTRTHELLELEVYSIDDFVRRSKDISSQLESETAQLTTLKQQAEKEKLQRETQAEFIPKVKTLLEVYYSLSSPADKNRFLKEVIERCEYFKTERGKGSANKFDLVLYPKINLLST